MRLIDADELIVMEFGGIEFVPKEFIDDAPIIEPERKKEKWIPCNTQEPDGIGCYLLYRPHFWPGNNGQITVCHWNGHRWSDNYTDDESRELPDVRGMAWMPLPMPWKGEEDESERRSMGTV